MKRFISTLALVVLLAAWTHGNGSSGTLLTDSSTVLLTNASGDLLTP